MGPGASGAVTCGSSLRWGDEKKKSRRKGALRPGPMKVDKRRGRLPGGWLISKKKGFGKQGGSSASLGEFALRGRCNQKGSQKKVLWRGG